MVHSNAEPKSLPGIKVVNPWQFLATVTLHSAVVGSRHVLSSRLWGS
jgi:hypothetical protein